MRINGRAAFDEEPIKLKSDGIVDVFLALTHFSGQKRQINKVLVKESRKLNMNLS